MNLETDNPEKGQLLRRSEVHRELLEADVKQITERSEQLLTNALVIGGALALTYLLLRGITGSSGTGRKSRSRKDKQPISGDGEVVVHEEEPGILSHVGNLLAAQAAGFLLSVAREKLVEYLQSQGVKKG
jgi:hypothetical protein